MVIEDQRKTDNVYSDSKRHIRSENGNWYVLSGMPDQLHVDKLFIRFMPDCAGCCKEDRSYWPFFKIF